MKPTLLLLLLAALAVGCSKETGGEFTTNCDESTINLSGNYEADLADQNQRFEEIRDMVANRSASKANQCHTMAVGAKACGGPATYIIYSTKNVNESDLEDRVCYYTAFQRAMNTEYELVSDCALEAAPNIELRDGTCEVVN